MDLLAGSVPLNSDSETSPFGWITVAQAAELPDKTHIRIVGIPADGPVYDWNQKTWFGRLLRKCNPVHLPGLQPDIIVLSTVDLTTKQLISFTDIGWWFKVV